MWCIISRHRLTQADDRAFAGGVGMGGKVLGFGRKTQDTGHVENRPTRAIFPNLLGQQLVEHSATHQELTFDIGVKGDLPPCHCTLVQWTIAKTATTDASHIKERVNLTIARNTGLHHRLNRVGIGQFRGQEITFPTHRLQFVKQLLTVRGGAAGKKDPDPGLHG